MDTTASPPKPDFEIAPLRAGLRIAAVEGEAFVNVQNERGQYFRLRLAALQMLQSISTKSSAQEFVATLPATKQKAAMALLELAVKADLLALNQASASPTRPPRNILFFELLSVDPAWLLKFVAPLYRPLFSRWGALTLLLGLGLTIWQGIEVNIFAAQQFSVFRDFTSWPWIYALLALSSLLHEMGHAYACERNGIKPGKLSVALYFFQISTYVNVSEAWLYPKRRQRVEIALAGLYVEAFLALLSAQALIHLDPYTLPSGIALIFFCILAARMLVNSLPVLRLDGYWLLSDLLGEPNLRARASAYVMSQVMSLWRPVRLAFTPRNKLAYWSFFTLSALVLCIVFARAVALLNDWMSSYGIAMRVLALTVLVGFIVPPVWSHFVQIRRNYLLNE